MNEQRRKQYRKSKITELLDEMDSNVSGHERAIILWLAEMEARYLLWRERHIRKFHWVGGQLRSKFFITILGREITWWLPR